MAARDTASDSETVKADVEKLREDLNQLKEHLLAMGKGRYDKARREGSAAVDDIRSELSGLVRDMEADGRQAMAGLEREVREKPLLSLLAAFGIGMLISQFVGRGR